MMRIMLIGLAGAFLLVSGVSAQQPGGKMMMSMMDSADARLDRLVSTMNKTTGSKKVQAMAAVINELVAQRKMMRVHARQMMGTDGMMGDRMGADTSPRRSSDTGRSRSDHQP